MRNVSVIGIGETKMGSYPEKTLDAMILEAGEKAIADAGIEKSLIEAVYMGNFNGSQLCNQSQVGALACEALGLSDVPSIRVEAACASGGLAFRQAYIAVAAGLYKCVLVGGVEKMTHCAGDFVTQAIASATKYDEEAARGVTFPAAFALIATRYMYTYKMPREHLASVPVQSHANALLNPDAQMHKEINIEKAINSQMIAFPLTLYDCSLVTDGAAFAVICAQDFIPSEVRKQNRVIDIAGSGHGGDYLTLSGKSQITSFNATKQAAKDAYAMANVKARDISLAEVHDCFSITQVINTEDLGFFEAGTGGLAAFEGRTAIGNTNGVAINTSGGLKSKGHPIGATGISQIYEAVTQLRYEAGQRQVKNANIALTQNLGGTAATCAIHIFKRMGE